MAVKRVTALLWLIFASLFAMPVFAQGLPDYEVQVGDKLTVSVYGKPEISGTFSVRADGNIVLHLLGEIPAAGATFTTIEGRIVERAAEKFSSKESALVDIAEFRKIFVLGSVQNPGTYAYSPGMNVMKAIALAGGFERVDADTSFDREIDAARRRVLESQTHLKFAEAERDGLVAELARLAGQTPEPKQNANDDTLTNQIDLIGLRRLLSERFSEGAERKKTLANDEAKLFMQRRDLIDSQLSATEEQLNSISNLAERGLVRREQALDLQVKMDSFRADALEAAAFEARARQTAANADSEFSVEQMKYEYNILDDKITADEQVLLARNELEASLQYLQTVNPAAAQSLGGDIIATVYEVYKSGSTTPTVAVLTTPLGPDDVVMVRFEVQTQ